MRRYAMVALVCVAAVVRGAVLLARHHDQARSASLIKNQFVLAGN